MISDDGRRSRRRRCTGCWAGCPSSRSRFRHDASNQLPHDVVIVDEMSMVSLTMMARLLEAVRPSARLVLVGDPDQLSSVEAGAVLADIARAPGRPDADLGRQLVELGLSQPARPAPVHGVVQLTHTWRFGGAIDTLAAGDPGGRCRRGSGRAALRRKPKCSSPRLILNLRRHEASAGCSGGHRQHRCGRPVSPCYEGRQVGRRPGRAGRSGPASSAVRASARAVRGASGGVWRWSAGWPSRIPGYGEDGEWYVGRPLLVTANDYEMGSTTATPGVIVDDARRCAGRLRPRREPRRSIRPCGWTPSRPCMQ